MPESQNGHESGVELDPNEIEPIVEEIASDIESAVTGFLLENSLGGELSIQLETNLNPGVIPEHQLVAIMNARLVEEDIPCQVVSVLTGEGTVSLLLEVTGSEEKEQTVKTVHRTFSNTCAFCKSTVIEEADVPANSYGKIKKGKGGKQSRDWNLGPRPCTCGRDVFLFDREYLN